MPEVERAVWRPQRPMRSQLLSIRGVCDRGRIMDLSRIGEARDDRRFPPPGAIVEVDGRRVHLLRAGAGHRRWSSCPGSGLPPSNGARCWRCCRSRWRCALSTGRGIGWSDAGPWSATPVGLAEWTARLLEVLQVSSVVLVGHSMGGVVARVCAATTPDRITRLVLVDSSHEDQLRDLGRLDREASAAGVVGAAAVQWLRCPAGWRRFVQDVRGRRRLLREIAGIVPDELADGAVGQLGVPPCRRGGDAGLRLRAARGSRSRPQARKSSRHRGDRRPAGYHRCEDEVGLVLASSALTEDTDHSGRAAYLTALRRAEESAHCLSR
ncbi:alpha/beta fold hydrolase [Amycolatopsis sp. SID8362]|nr:alpha/beta fold hydrolase [Amycolatopsis sp. SID8362]